MKVFDWIVRIVAAVILLQTLFFKFLGADESVFIFSQLGAEPWGRIASGLVELLASTLLLSGPGLRCAARKRLVSSGTLGSVKPPCPPPLTGYKRTGTPAFVRATCKSWLWW